jgi:hypothetical protein
MWNSKIDVPYTSEAKKLEPEIQKHDGTSRSQTYRGTYHLAKSHVEQQLQMH